MTPQLFSFVNSVRRFFGRHHPVVFISVISLLMAIAIFLLYQVFASTNSPQPENSSTISDFDQKTIDKIKTLHDSSSADTTITLPSPRSNPFVE